MLFKGGNLTELRYRKGRVVGRILSGAVRLWLRSQVSSISDLKLDIIGGDRELLSGSIPKVILSATDALYQGLSLSYVDLVAEKIMINVGQVLRRKPLRLIEPVPITGEIWLASGSLQSSLDSSLLQSGLLELLQLLLVAQGVSLSEYMFDDTINWYKILLSENKFTIDGDFTDGDLVKIDSELYLAGHNELLLKNTRVWIGKSKFERLELLINLGSDTGINELIINSDGLLVRGTLLVRSD